MCKGPSDIHILLFELMANPDNIDTDANSDVTVMPADLDPSRMVQQWGTLSLLELGVEQRGPQWGAPQLLAASALVVMYDTPVFMSCIYSRAAIWVVKAGCRVHVVTSARHDSAVSDMMWIQQLSYKVCIDYATQSKVTRLCH